MRVLSLVFLCLTLASCSLWSHTGFSSPPPLDTETPIAKLSNYSGTVLIKSQGQWGVLPRINMPLYNNDRVVTLNGTALLTFDDSCRIGLCNNSNLQVSQKRMRKAPFRNFRPIERDIVLYMGKAYFDTNESFARNHIITPATIFTVLEENLGNVSVNKKQKTYIQLEEGHTVMKIGDYKKGNAPVLAESEADKTELLLAVLAAEMAQNQAEAAVEEYQAGNMTAAQKAWYEAQYQEYNATEVKVSQSLLAKYNPDKLIWYPAKKAAKQAEEDEEVAMLARERAEAAGAMAPDLATTPTEEEVREESLDEEEQELGGEVMEDL